MQTALSWPRLQLARRGRCALHNRCITVTLPLHYRYITVTLLGVEGARALGVGLTGGATLTFIDLADNQIRDEGACPQSHPSALSAPSLSPTTHPTPPNLPLHTHSPRDIFPATR